MAKPTKKSVVPIAAVAVRPADLAPVIDVGVKTAYRIAHRLGFVRVGPAHGGAMRIPLVVIAREFGESVAELVRDELVEKRDVRQWSIKAER